MKRQIVIDACATGCWLFSDEESKNSDRLFADVLQGKIRLIQPSLWAYEIINMIRSAAVLKKRIKEEDGKKLLCLWNEVPAEYEEYEPRSSFGILNDAFRHQLTGYDAVYFHLAERSGIELFTEDAGLLKLKRKFAWIKKLHEYT